MRKYKAILCDYVYDPEKGDPKGKISPGTPFEDLPKGWCCPKCRAGKFLFKPVKE